MLNGDNDHPSPRIECRHFRVLQVPIRPDPPGWSGVEDRHFHHAKPIDRRCHTGRSADPGGGCLIPFQQALLAIEIAVDALREADTEQASDALAQIAHLGFDTRPTEERGPSDGKGKGDAALFQ